MKKLIKSKLDTLWDKALEHSRDAKIAPHRIKELHPSAFPYCGLRHLYFKEHNPDSLKHRDYNMASDFYTSIGHNVHALVQDYFGVRVNVKGIRFYGNVRCTKCGETKKFVHKGNLRKSKHTWVYEEIRVRYGKYIRGAIDGLIRIELDGKFYWIVFDLKTASSRKIYMNASGKEHTLPTILNLAQIEAYCTAVEDEYDIDVWGHMLLYKGRETHFEKFAAVGELSKRKKKHTKNLLKTNNKSFGIVNSDVSMKKKFIKLYEIKPCQTKAWYNSNMRNPFEKVCPLAKHNKCFDREKAYEAVKKG